MKKTFQKNKQKISKDVKNEKQNENKFEKINIYTIYTK
jgi:hypothetical protein